ncbi:hypothetical protein MSG28_015130 [Choristoneura fumiferana]|uniref:Uncharacterized protein n=1 Tax=Choristoneura fumiferana TaxID=7141 RepID=A0ACC0KYC8_CHOFU|nr:hypothetical protein MSG28_015130 [Choristoneura fumiferana]
MDTENKEDNYYRRLRFSWRNCMNAHILHKLKEVPGNASTQASSKESILIKLHAFAGKFISTAFAVVQNLKSILQCNSEQFRRDHISLSDSPLQRNRRRALVRSSISPKKRKIPVLSQNIKKTKGKTPGGYYEIRSLRLV